MASKSALKERVCAVIDGRGREIIDVGETILHHPETGFKEFETARLVAARFADLGLDCQTGLALTGVKGRMYTGAPGPTLALLGELDALRVPDHPCADLETGAAHACGHNAQVAGMLGAAIGLITSGCLQHLAGYLVFFAVPAEELIELDYRLQLRAQGRIEFLTGKAELIRLGHFDDVDMAMMFHTKTDDITSHVAVSSNGAVVKHIRFIGKAAHAGSSPQQGINALNAASLALTAIGYLRETFYDGDTIRIHPIITRGGDAVNVIPADVRLETFIRGKTLDGIVDANRKVDDALRGAAMAIGAAVEITTVPGYLPQSNNVTMTRLWGENVARILGEGHFESGTEHRASSTDFGDLSHIMPAVHPYVAGAAGAGHTSTHALTDKEKVYITSAKLMAMTAIDLLYEDAAEARRIVETEKPKMTRREYLEFLRGLNSTTP